MTLNELPKIEILDTRPSGIEFSSGHLRSVNQETAACIFDGKEFFVYGFVSRLPDSERFFFEFGDGYGLVDFPAGPLFVFDAYWSERIELVVSDRVSWKEARFTRDGILSFPGGLVIKNSKGKLLDAEYVREQLEHEHCSICWGRLDIEHPILFHSGTHDYLCERCWAEFHKPKKIDFIESLGEFA